MSRFVENIFMQGMAQYLDALHHTMIQGDETCAFVGDALKNVSGRFRVIQLEITHSRENDESGGIGPATTHFKLEFVIE